MSRISKLKIGLASCGIAAGGDAVLEALKKATNLPIAEVGCIGHCYAEPLVEACLDDGSSIMYGNVKADEKVLPISFLSGKAAALRSRLPGKPKNCSKFSLWQEKSCRPSLKIILQTAVTRD